MSSLTIIGDQRQDPEGGGIELFFTRKKIVFLFSLHTLALTFTPLQSGDIADILSNIYLSIFWVDYNSIVTSVKHSHTFCSYIHMLINSSRL